MEEDLEKQLSDESESEKEQKQKVEVIPGLEGLSKSQRKKLIKKEKWEKQKLLRRKQKKEKERQKKKEKRQKEKEEDPKEQNPDKIKEGEELELHTRKRRQDYAQKMKQGLSVVIDLQFWDLMTEKEQNSLIKQLGHCHSSNRKQQKCFNYILTSATKQRQKILSQRYNADRWGITMHEQSLIDVFPIEKLVYLTGDASEDIEKFDPELVYIIGGIVDHNRLKKITLEYAESKKIVTKRLPMHNVKLKASVHFAVNHVWEWMLKGYNGMDWGEALKSIIPQRKLQEIIEK